MLKFSIKQYVLKTWLDNARLPSSTKASMRMALMDHVNYRRNCRFPQDEVDLSWKADWSTGAMAYFSIFEAPH